MRYIVVELGCPLATSEPVTGASRRAQRRARRISAAARVNLPTNLARLAADGALVEGLVNTFG